MFASIVLKTSEQKRNSHTDTQRKTFQFWKKKVKELKAIVKHLIRCNGIAHRNDVKSKKNRFCVFVCELRKQWEHLHMWNGWVCLWVKSVKRKKNWFRFTVVQPNRYVRIGRKQHSATQKSYSFYALVLYRVLSLSSFQAIRCKRKCFDQKVNDAHTHLFLFNWFGFYIYNWNYLCINVTHFQLSIQSTQFTSYDNNKK